MDTASALDRLRTERNVWFVTVRPDGRPHLAPVWFVHVDDHLWICTGARSVKVRNLVAHPTVSVGLEDGDAPVVAEGRAHVVDRPFPAAVVRAFADRYDWDITEPHDADIGEPALVRIDVDRWLLDGPGLPVSPRPRT